MWQTVYAIFNKNCPPPPPRRNPRRRAARGYNLNDRQIAIALQEEENNQAAGDARDININDYNENE